MAIKKSVFDIEIRAGEFDAFYKRYKEYQASLRGMPAAWRAVNEQIKGTRSGFDKIVASMVAENVQAKLREKAQERADRITQTTAERWAGIARSTRSVAGNIAGATASLLKWGALTGLVSGLLGGGGLYGIDRMALNVAAGRRSSLGLGVGYGDQKAFGTNFGRLVDPESFLANVAGAKSDVTRRVGLIGAGLTGGEIGGSNSDTAVALLRNLKRIADQSNPAMFAQILQSRRLDQFATPEDLRRLRATSPEEYRQLEQGYRRDRSGLDLPPDVARKWQDFTTQMSRAGQGIENVFVRGLAPLAPALSSLSSGFEKVAKAFLVEGGPLEKWIKVAADGIERFAAYIGTPTFEQNVKDFVVGIGELASSAVRVARFFGLISGPSLDVATVPPTQLGSRGDMPKTTGEAKFNGWMNYLASGMSRSGSHNPGNMRLPGQSTGFATFPTDEAGVKAMERQLQIYAGRDKLNTIEGIISKYAPRSENDTKAYVGNVSKRTGFGANQPLDMSDKATLGALIAAMVKQEHGPGAYDKYKDPKTVVEILNTTGGAAAVSVNGLKN